MPEDPIVIGALELNIKPLAALFKLADILHADYRRVDNAKAVNPKERARHCIRGWKYDTEGRIKFWADPSEISDLEHIHRAVAMMRQDIEKIAPILRYAGYPYEITVAEIDESKLMYTVQADQLSNRTFLGMDSFCEDEQHLLKGRAKEIQELYQKLLTKDPITALVGDSGIGKTSLVKAGLFPILRKAGWKFAYVRILHDNITEVIQGVWFQIMESDSPSPEISFINTLRQISKQNQHNNVLILFDQFEDILRFGNVFNHIKEALYYIQAMRFRNLRVLLCYRSDFEVQIGHILQDIAYSLHAIPKFYLRELDRNGTEDAFIAGMSAAQIGFDPNLVCKDFIKLIVDDIERQGQRILPPIYSDGR